MTITEVRFEQKAEDDKLEALRMEHFYLPIGLWFVGTLISIFCFLAEIIIIWISKRKAVRLSNTEGAEDTSQELSELLIVNKHLKDKNDELIIKLQTYMANIEDELDNSSNDSAHDLKDDISMIVPQPQPESLKQECK